MRRSPTWPSPRRPARSKRARRAAPIASANTISSCASKRSSGPRPATPAAHKSEVRSQKSDFRLQTSDFRLTCMHKVVLLRHGESIWNKENRFTGWTDVDLSERGLAEAQE